MSLLQNEPIDPNELKYSILTEDDLKTLKQLKNVLVKSQLYAEAALLRDLEKRIMILLEAQKILGVPKQESLERHRKDLVRCGGHWIPIDGVNSITIGDIKIRVRCEHDGCGETFGREYKRIPTGGSMDREPIFLCDNHSSGLEPYST